jgi:hypothetical protein
MNNLWDTYENIYYELLQQFKQIDELRSLEYKFDFNLFHEMNHERKMAKIYYQNLKLQNKKTWADQRENENSNMIIVDGDSGVSSGDRSDDGMGGAGRHGLYFEGEDK